MMNPLVVLKLGGSLITHKDRPLSPNVRGMRLAGRTVSRILRHNSGMKLIVIHGGGSFGHYYASRFHANTDTRNISSEGIAKISEAMIQLHSIVLKEMVDEGVRCRTITVSEILQGSNGIVNEHASGRLSALLTIGCVPITFGDIVTNSGGSSIISGDRIALALARKLDVERVVFAMDVDGIYSNSQMTGDIIPELTTRRGIGGKERKFDVTGGVESKIKIGFELARLGTEVFFVNGNKGKRLEGALMGEQETLSTKIHSKNISTAHE